VPWPLIGQRVQGDATSTAAGDESYRTIKAILAAGTEADGAGPGPSGNVAAVPAFPRGPEQLFTEPDPDSLAGVVPMPTTTGPTTTAGAGDLDCQAGA